MRGIFRSTAVGTRVATSSTSSVDGLGVSLSAYVVVHLSIKAIERSRTPSSVAGVLSHSNRTIRLKLLDNWN